MTLLEKLQSATAGSRELDAEIYEASTGEAPLKAIRGEYFCSDGYGLIPDFSRSLDAALTLARPFLDKTNSLELSIFSPSVDEENNAQAHDHAVASIGHGEFGARTLPLALCIAALRARANKGE